MLSYRTGDASQPTPSPVLHVRRSFGSLTGIVVFWNPIFPKAGKYGPPTDHHFARDACYHGLPEGSNHALVPRRVVPLRGRIPGEHLAPSRQRSLGKRLPESVRIATRSWPVLRDGQCSMGTLQPCCRLSAHLPRWRLQSAQDPVRARPRSGHPDHVAHARPHLWPAPRGTVRRGPAQGNFLHFAKCPAEEDLPFCRPLEGRQGWGTHVCYGLVSRLLARARVITLSRLHLVVAALGFDLDLAVRAIQLVVARRVAQVVLAAQFVLDLLERVAQFLLVVADFDDASAGFLRQLLHVAEAEALVPAAAVGDQDHVAYGVGLLRRLDGVTDFQPAAFVLAVGEHHHGLASVFVPQLLIGSQINRVIKRGAARMRVGHRASAQANRTAASGASADLQLVECARNGTYVVGEVLVEIVVGVKLNKDRRVLGAEHGVKNPDAGLLLDGQHALLAGACVDQNAERERLVGIGAEILDGLGLAVFEHVEVALHQAGNQQTVVVLHIKEDADHVDLRLEGLSRLFGFLRTLVLD